MLSARAQQLKNTLGGQLLCSGDAAYDVVRRVFNAMIDRRPAFIAHCRSAADVTACVRFAREQGLVVSVRGGAKASPAKRFATMD